jgi:hypothetical protein
MLAWWREKIPAINENQNMVVHSAAHLSDNHFDVFIVPLKSEMIFHINDRVTLITEYRYGMKSHSFLSSCNEMVPNQLKTSKPLGNFETYLCICTIEIRNK